MDRNNENELAREAESSSEKFSFSSSAKEREEIKQIRKKYTDGQTGTDTIDKLERLRALDRSVTNKGTAVSLFLGILGCLILGVGMSIIMTELGDMLGKWALPLGIAAGVLGIAIVAIAYPVYNLITKKERERIAPEILSLSEELMK